MEIKPTVVIVAYRRLESLKRLLRSVDKASYFYDDITLIISIDYHPDNQEVIRCAQDFVWHHGEKIIRTHETNQGLRKHIMECGDDSFKYGAVIILEDDEVVAPSFYEYARLAHEYYGKEERIAGVSLYGHEWNDYAGKRFQPIHGNGDVYFGQFSCTRGQSWLSGQWAEFKEWYERNQEITEDERLPSPIYAWKKSWGKFFVRYMVEREKYYVIPYRTVSTMFGEIGTHASIPQFDVQVPLYWGAAEWKFIPFEEGAHYDIFFENKDLKGILAKRYQIPESEVCIDIYALADRKYGRARYILTTRKLNARIVESFDLNMRPQDINVLLDIRGEGIFLYDVSKYVKNRRYRRTFRLEYDLGGVHGLEAFLYGTEHCWKVLMSLLSRK